MVNINVAVDGTAGSGKSTVMLMVANKLKMKYIDTGMMYRAFTKFCLNNEIDFLNNEAIEKQLEKFNFIYINEKSILVNGLEYSPYLYNYDVNENIKYVAKNQKVRNFMVKEQQKLAITKNNIVIGRDITTVVLPDAELKIYFDCSVEERARRRYEQNKAKKIFPNNYEDILRQISQRDEYDKTRSTGALKITSDAWYIDTSKYSLNELVDMVIEKIISF